MALAVNPARVSRHYLGRNCPLCASNCCTSLTTKEHLAQVPPLVLGDNPAAQLHADSMMAYGYRSHWDTNGLTSHMRYTLAGGTGRVLENIAGPVAIVRAGAAGLETIGPALEDAHAGFMSSPEEAANLLGPRHRRVNLGIACSVSHCWVVQQFEGRPHQLYHPAHYRGWHFSRSWGNFNRGWSWIA